MVNAEEEALKWLVLARVNTPGAVEQVEKYLQDAGVSYDKLETTAEELAALRESAQQAQVNGCNCGCKKGGKFSAETVN